MDSFSRDRRPHDYLHGEARVFQQLGVRPCLKMLRGKRRRSWQHVSVRHPALVIDLAGDRRTYQRVQACEDHCSDSSDGFDGFHGVSVRGLQRDDNHGFYISPAGRENLYRSTVMLSSLVCSVYHQPGLSLEKLQRLSTRCAEIWRTFAKFMLASFQQGGLGTCYSGMAK